MCPSARIDRYTEAPHSLAGSVQASLLVVLQTTPRHLTKLVGVVVVVAVVVVVVVVVAVIVVVVVVGVGVVVVV